MSRRPSQQTSAPVCSLGWGWYTDKAHLETLLDEGQRNRASTPFIYRPASAVQFTSHAGVASGCHWQGRQQLPAGAYVLEPDTVPATNKKRHP